MLRILRILTVLLTVLLGGGWAMHPTSAQDNPGVSAARFAHLARGINLPFWFWYGPDNLDETAAVFTATDFAEMRSLGFTFVRVPIDLDFLLDTGDPDLLRDDALAIFDTALADLLAHDLAVVVDIHSTDEEHPANIFSGRLEDNPAFVDTFAAFWTALATHLNTTDPERVFLEVLNEPVYDADPAQWPPIQARLVAAIRQGAPDHTIIVTGARWSNLDTLLELEPLDDLNVIYNFHFYEPFPFTHQGADWAGPDVLLLRDIPYPSTPENVESAAQQLAAETAGTDQDWIPAWVREYGAERWNAARIAGRIQLAADWGRQHGVRLMCNEFGAYTLYATPADRIAWLRDVRTAFEQQGIAWAMWEYHHDFGLVRREGGRTFVDLDVARALGLLP